MVYWGISKVYFGPFGPFFIKGLRLSKVFGKTGESFRGSRQTKKNHDWISLWIMFSIIWDNFGVNVEPFLVPNIARGPPCRPQRRPRYRPARPRRTMIGSVFASCFRSSGTILASLWNHVWCPKSPKEPFLVPKIARGPPCRPLRCPRRHPMGPGTSQEHPY